MKYTERVPIIDVQICEFLQRTQLYNQYSEQQQ